MIWNTPEAFSLFKKKLTDARYLELRKGDVVKQLSYNPIYGYTITGRTSNGHADIVYKEYIDLLSQGFKEILPL